VSTSGEGHRADRRRQASLVGPREVSPLELLNDLVFVFAVWQLSEHLLHDLTWHGAVETLVLGLGETP
jgi:low temperature requirement protein LtrA